MRRAVVLMLAIGCRFSAGHAAGSDAGAIDAADAAADAARPLDAPPDAALAVPALVQALEPGYGKNSVAITATVQAGDLLVVATYTSNLTDAMTVTDTAAATWTSVPAVTAATGCAPRLQWWYAPATASSPDVITVAQPLASAIGAALLEYAGLDAASPLDVAGGVVAPVASAIADPGALVTTAPDVIVGAYADLNGVGTITPGTGLTGRGTDTGFYALVGDDVPGVVAGSYDLTATLPAGKNDACWTAAVAALRIATQ